jgi:hypothetical protein
MKVDLDTLERLVELAEGLGVDETDLDEVVHECAQGETLDELNGTDAVEEQEEIISGSEERASEINNGGLESQIEYLLLRNSEAEVEELIRSASSVE